MRFQREAVEEIELPPPPSESTGRTFIGPAPAPRPGRRKALGSRAPLPQAVVVQTDPFAPVQTEVIAPELVAAAIAGEKAAAAAATPVPPPAAEVAPVAEPELQFGVEPELAAELAPPVAPPELEFGIEPELLAELAGPIAEPISEPIAPPVVEEGPLPGESFHLEPIALDPGTIALARTEPFVPEPTAPEPLAPEPMAEEPRVVFHPERLLPVENMATDLDLPPPVALENLSGAAPLVVEAGFSEMLQPGTLIDEYEVVALVASDATGSLYAAHDSVEQPFAIKVIARSVIREESSLEKLVSSALASRQLDSLHLVEIHGAGRLNDGRVYLVMEPLVGETLSARMARGRLPIDEAMEILSQLAAAVADVHKAGLIRCDIAPDSVMVRQSEEGIEVKLLQVGMAALSRGSSPERSRGDAVGAPADVHALGLLAQYMLIGTPVDQSLVVSEARPEVPAAVDRLIDAMLADDPRRRPTALEVHGAARKLAHALYRGTSIDLPFRMQARLWLQKPSNRILLGVQICLVAAGLLSYIFLRDGDSSEATAAPQEPAATEPQPAPAAAPAPAPAPKAAAAQPKKAAPAAKPAAAKPSKTEAAKPSKSEAAKPSKSEAAKPSKKPAPVAAPKPAAPPPRAPAAPTAEPKGHDRDAPIKDPFGDM